MILFSLDDPDDVEFVVTLFLFLALTMDFLILKPGLDLTSTSDIAGLLDLLEQDPLPVEATSEPEPSP